MAELASFIQTGQDTWKTLFEESPLPMLVVDASTFVVAANRSAELCYGAGEGGLDWLNIRQLLVDEERGRSVALTTPTNGPSLVKGSRHRRLDGTTFPTRIHVRELGPADSDLVLVTIWDSEEPDLLDPASGLPDPRLFIDRLEQSVVHAHREGVGLSTCFVLIDHLEIILHGADPEVGTRLWHEIGHRLRSNLRESDTVARVGTAEIALIIEGVDEEIALVEVLRKALADFDFEFTVGAKAVLLDVSIGAAFYPRDGHDAGMLMATAAAAARLAQKEGGEQIRFFPKT